MIHASGIILPCTDLTPALNDLLRKQAAPSVSGKVNLDANALESFLKESYRINSHITSLHRELRDVRQSYLSTAQPRRMPSRSSAGQAAALTDREREDIDINAKQMIRELNASIRGLEEAEQLRRETQSAVIRKQHVGGLGALSSWASGGRAGRKTVEREAAEAQAQQLALHRDSVLWRLRQRLELCCRTQQDMMETRLTREMNRSRGLLSPLAADFASFSASSAAARPRAAGSTGESSQEEATASHPTLTQEQIQMFEEDNQDMMKHFESTLGKVRTAEKSLVEISELQSLLVNNLATQSANIEQLVTDSFSTAENVGSGNKQLEKAARRPSAARYTFFAASGLCAFLVAWDLLF